MKQQKHPLRHRNLLKKGLCFAAIFGLLSCQLTKEKQPEQQPQTEVQLGAHNDLTNFGEPNFNRFTQRLRDPSARVHIVQMGDSHTAADFFSGALRDKFQARYGDAGIGLVPPSNIVGQRSANLIFTEPKKQWSFLTSRKDNAPNFPLGGFIISPLAEHSSLMMKERNASVNQYNMQALYQADYPASLRVQSNNVAMLNLQPSSGWRFSEPVPVVFPATITTNQQTSLNIGGWLITRDHPGVMLSSVGINGATIAMMDKWAAQWINTLADTAPDMVILAYGTNEAFNDTLDLALYREQLTSIVGKIRQTIPNAVILLVGPGDSIKNKAAPDCHSQQPANLRNVIKVQQSVAKSEGLLYWDWQQYMGGDCAMNNWAQNGLARPDKVHFTVGGYERSAKALYKALDVLISQQ
ncbi:SGNH/GDSL hydrolase family protein [Serratia sp. DD3]|uniref:SGNH/GDSL hydrolase family protein n=1 Tax=Serratia sp. DD3 TaxID=1410619 RepID=UPI0003C526F3|nr:SGNH/GDSL hydrolase family protein [Serratia sp. DD3]KEY59202.1 hypothetical protein SRDD_19000 [Serratia sp. DD3]